MKFKDFILYSCIFLICVGFTAEVVSYQLTGDHLFRPQKDLTIKERTGTCSDRISANRPATNDPQLKALPEYEKVCGSAFPDDMMIFTNMPISVPNAQAAADKMAIRLKEFNKQSVSPIVIAEPDSDWGLIDFQEFAAGNYDAWVTAYFAQLKHDGITDSMLGLWIPFPEPQQSNWNNNGNPDDFAASVNRYFTSLRQSFPLGRTGILLDSQVGENNQAPQLLAYTRLVDNSLVDVAGLQGFPWHPTEEGDQRQPITSASQFAPAYLLEEVAKSLNTKEVLLNIGTYRHRKTSNGGDIAVATSERQKTLDSIAYETTLLVKQDYKVTVNIFAENKFDVKEGIDWSYWPPGSYGPSEQTALFVNFVRQLEEYGVTTSLYDARS